MSNDLQALAAEIWEWQQATFGAGCTVHGAVAKIRDECIEAIAAYDSGAKRALREELADVYFMLSQLGGLLCVNFGGHLTPFTKEDFGFYLGAVAVIAADAAGEDGDLPTAFDYWWSACLAAGFDMADMLQAIRDKFTKNRARTWAPPAKDGTISHVKGGLDARESPPCRAGRVALEHVVKDGIRIGAKTTCLSPPVADDAAQAVATMTGVDVDHDAMTLAIDEVVAGVCNETGWRVPTFLTDAVDARWEYAESSGTWVCNDEWGWCARPDGMSSLALELSDGAVFEASRISAKDVPLRARMLRAAADAYEAVEADALLDTMAREAKDRGDVAVEHAASLLAGHDKACADILATVDDEAHSTQLSTTLMHKVYDAPHGAESIRTVQSREHADALQALMREAFGTMGAKHVITAGVEFEDGSRAAAVLLYSRGDVTFQRSVIDARMAWLRRALNLGLAK